MPQETTRHSCIRVRRMNNTITDEQKVVRKRRAKKARIRRAIITTFLVISLMCAIGIAAYMYNMYRQAEAEADATMAELNTLKSDMEAGSYITTAEARNLVNAAVDEAVDEAIKDTKQDYLSRIRSYMEEGETLTMLENIYPDNIVVPDTGRYWFFDVDSSLKLSEVDYSKIEYPVLNEESGEYEGEAYYNNGDIKAKKGIDVSKFQGDIDWNSVKNDGVEFVFIRLGFRGYESGKIVIDDNYEDNITGCNDAGIDCGVYFFTEAKTEAEGREEAEFVLENLADHHIELPIVIDVEQSANVAKSRTKGLTKEDRTKAVIAFCERIRQAGYEPMIYGNLKSQMVMLDNTQLEDYEKWFAYYHYPLRYPYKHRIWQYTAKGKVAGIKGDADLNLMFY